MGRACQRISERHSASNKVKEYLEKRNQYEGKEVTLLKYNNTEAGLQLHKEETAGQE